MRPECQRKPYAIWCVAESLRYGFRFRLALMQANDGSPEVARTVRAMTVVIDSLQEAMAPFSGMGIHA